MRQITDPNELKKLPRYVRAFRWRLPWEVSQWLAKLTFKSFVNCYDPSLLNEYLAERGPELEDTAVTTGQKCVLVRALQATEGIDFPVAEVGSWRGVTTAALAAHTGRTLYAVDPYNGYGGCDDDMESFCNRTKGLGNVKHLRLTSGEAVKKLSGERLSLVFIDAIHDYLNTWFDFNAWGALVVKRGMIAFHDVDDHAGTNLACRRILRGKEFVPWGYCPNMVVFQRL